MYSKLLVFVVGLFLCAPCIAQVNSAAEGSRANFSAGGGFDYWQGDWSGVSRFGPSVWVTDEFWHGIGINIEGHSMIIGGGAPSPKYKYFVGEGGFIYNYYRYPKFTPFAKAEIGFASLSFPHNPTATYTHDTRNTWAVGGGAEFKLSRHIWTRIDYTYDGFPNFYSEVTGLHRTLDPSGISFGPTYHFR
jgi:opacity protein-like surface antigen